MKSTLGLLLLIAASPVAHAKACPADAMLQRITGMGNVYIGELHGTQESPAFLRCLVAYEIAHHVKSLTVSVEFAESARDMNAPDWRANDGRTSVAMASLLQWLMAEEARGHLSLHFQRGKVDSNDDFDHRVGDALRGLATKGHVIAYSGNFHNMKVAPPGLNVVPAGAYVGPTFTHIAIVDVNGGTAWFSTAEGTGVHKLTAKRAGYGKPGTLIDGHENGYDFMYLVPTFSASPPSKPTPAGGAHQQGGAIP
jgi:hypothetical protein